MMAGWVQGAAYARPLHPTVGRFSGPKAPLNLPSKISVAGRRRHDSISFRQNL